MVKDWNNLTESSRNRIISIEARLWKHGLKAKEFMKLDTKQYKKEFGSTIKPSSLKGQKSLVNQLIKYRSDEATTELLKRDDFKGKGLDKQKDFIKDLLDIEDKETIKTEEEQDVEAGDSDIDIGGGASRKQKSASRLRQWAVDNDFDADLIWELEVDELFEYLQKEGCSL